jgi:O-acetyl-ADP-ribose deacetylase (regulator of RNase III)
MQRFDLSPACRLVIAEGDLTKYEADAIVNAANECMLGGGGVDGAIHRAAGPELLQACQAMREVRPWVRCPTGQARITPGFDLPAHFVIHTVGPMYEHHADAPAALACCHRESLKLARANGCRSIAFPAISCGVYGYPVSEAATIALQTAQEFGHGIREISFVLLGKETYEAFLTAAEALE